jgi:hypothetical protein
MNVKFRRNAGGINARAFASSEFRGRRGIACNGSETANC